MLPFRFGFVHPWRRASESRPGNPAPAGLGAVLVDRGAEALELLSRVRPSPAKKQEQAKWSTSNMGVFGRIWAYLRRI